MEKASRNFLSQISLKNLVFTLQEKDRRIDDFQPTNFLEKPKIFRKILSILDSKFSSLQYMKLFKIHILEIKYVILIRAISVYRNITLLR